MKLIDVMNADGTAVETTADHIEAQVTAAAAPPNEPPDYYKVVKNRPRPPKNPKYPFKDMEVDDSVDIPLDLTVARNETDPVKQLKQRFETMHNRLHQAFNKVKRTALPGSKFHIEDKAHWVRVWRTA